MQWTRYHSHQPSEINVCAETYRKSCSVLICQGNVVTKVRAGYSGLCLWSLFLNWYNICKGGLWRKPLLHPLYLGLNESIAHPGKCKAANSVMLPAWAWWDTEWKLCFPEYLLAHSSNIYWVVFAKHGEWGWENTGELKPPDLPWDTHGWKCNYTLDGACS